MNRHLKFVTGGGLLIALFGGASLFYCSPTAMNEKKGLLIPWVPKHLRQGRFLN
jgi:hypothetical protein